MTESTPPRVPEQWKYEKAYQFTDYRMGLVRRHYVYGQIYDMEPGSTYLDVGCGRGETLKLAEEGGIFATGTEIVPDLCGGNVVWADIEHLPFDDGQFQYVSCNDVMEHLVPGTEGRALDELGRVCSKRLYITTNNFEHKLPSGEDLHINRRPRTAWHHDILSRFWGGQPARGENMPPLDCSFAIASNITTTEYGMGRNQNWVWKINFGEGE